MDTKIRSEVPPGVVIRPPRGIEKDGTRHCLVVAGPGKGDKFGIHNNTGVNLMRGIVERVFYVNDTGRLAPPAQPKDFSRKMNKVTRRILRWVPTVPVITREEFRDSHLGNRRKWLRYDAAMESLVDSPLTERDSRIATFVKCEKINFTKKPDPAPRVIQPRKPRFIMEMGRYIKPLEHVLYDHLSRKLYRHPCISKGFNAVKTAELIREKWVMFDSPVCVGMDASRFDQHVSVPALQWTHRIYLNFFQNDPYLKWILRQLLHNKGSAECKDCSIHYQVDGRRMSGDIDTALGNCLLMVAMTWAYCDSIGVKHQVMNNGDDIIVIMEQSDLVKFEGGVISWFEELGFKMEVEAPVTAFEQIEFCQTAPVWNGEGYVMMRTLSAISKDLTCIIGVSDIRQWLKAVGECGIALTSGIPVYQSFYCWMCRIGRSSSIVRAAGMESGMQFMAKGMTDRRREVTCESRVSFYAATGILPDAQEAIEGYYNGLGWKDDKVRDIDFNELYQRSVLHACYEGKTPEWGT